MKTIKTAFFSLLVLFIGTSLITSCSKDDETNKGVSENAKVSTYLKSFYSTNYQLGKSVEATPKSNSSSLNRSAEFDNLLVTEVFVGNDTMARGYIITDKNTSDFLYFIDVDRVNFKLTSTDIEANDSKTFSDINDLDKYITTNGLDYIKIAEDYILETIPTEDGRLAPFWGTGYSYGQPPATGPCMVGVYSNYYVFGINVTGDADPVMITNANGHYVQAQVPCGTAYQP
jgi:hypothetical protein